MSSDDPFLKHRIFQQQNRLSTYRNDSTALSASMPTANMAVSLRRSSHADSVDHSRDTPTNSIEKELERTIVCNYFYVFL